ncbi:peptide-methionine (S)-S-oxide reductase MsrA [Candidatus Binatus soli]|jgi:peptide-methionine (S)-S-oxide reductase|uniref:peptide-methionine (S)-S-oxide reductase MsrA n=1 Tax=Candidatus Binatus soli TaxID=1953413 RepID=UPI003D0F92F2
MDKMNKIATFGAGCFWGVESAFRAVKGVVDAVVGYAGGTVPKPDYRAVCTGKTGHAEVVQVEYDPARVSYEQLLEVFWQIHDPSTLNRQGPDVGTQYRSIIFYSDDHERAAAEESKRRLEESGKLARPIVTQIVPATEFYRAEDHHQRYYERRGIAPSCAIHAR